MRAPVLVLVVVVAAVVLAAVLPACQLFGERARCNPATEGVNHACAVDEECGDDHFCRKLSLEQDCAPRAEAASASLHMTVGSAVGVAAMGDDLFGTAAVLVADAHTCNSRVGAGCAGQIANPAGTQPLGSIAALDDDVQSTSLSQSPIRFDPPPALDYAHGFTLEAVVRTPAALAPSAAPLSAIASMSHAGDGWILGVDATGALVLRTGAFDTALAPPSAAVWHHVLCSVDVPALRTAADPDDDNAALDVACVIDGHLAAPAERNASGQTLSAVAHPLVLGGIDTSPASPTLDGAQVAVVRVWPRGDLAPGVRAVDREDSLIDEERARLMRYLGINIDVAKPRFLATNNGTAARLVPVLGHFEIVDGGWPRMFHSKSGSRGLLLEPDRQNLLEPVSITCPSGNTTFTSLDGRSDACVYPSLVALSPGTQVSQHLERGGTPDFDVGSSFVFTGFLRMPPVVLADGAELHIHIDGAAGGAFDINCDCDLVRDGTLTPGLATGASPGCSLQSLDDNWFELTNRCTASSTTLNVAVHARGAVWAPQLELGADPTTPISFTASNGKQTRAQDRIVVDAPGLVNASATALRATVLSDGNALSMKPLLVADDAELSDRVARLETLTTPAGITPRIELTERATSLVVNDPVAWASGEAIKLGGDLGTTIDPCRGCVGNEAVESALPAPEQWQQVGFEGDLEPGLLLDAEVITTGTAPLPLALDVNATTPAAGCLEGARPLAALVACAQGACSEATPVVWQGKTSAVTAGPSVGEQAVGGTFTAAVSGSAPTDSLFVEVRFAPAGKSGDILVLGDDSGAIFRIATNDTGDALVEDGLGGVGLDLPGEWSTALQWTQLSCFIGVQSRCAVNAGEPVDLSSPVNVVGKKITSVVVGEAAEAVAFARVWQVAQVPKRDLDRELGARVAASFGLTAVARRAAFDIVEQRATASTITREGVTFAVGSHWPRLEDDGSGGVVYVADVDGEGLAVSTRDLSDTASTTIELAFAQAPPGTLLALTSTGGESLTLAADDSQLDVNHKLTGGAPSTVKLPGLTPTSLLFGARGAVLTLESGATNSLASAGGTVSAAPMTKAQIVSDGSPLKLHHLRIGTH